MVLSLSHSPILSPQKCAFKAVLAVQACTNILAEEGKEMNVVTPPEVREKGDVTSGLGMQEVFYCAMYSRVTNLRYLCCGWNTRAWPEV